jgi:hypothetical protein
MSESKSVVVYVTLRLSRPELGSSPTPLSPMVSCLRNYTVVDTLRMMRIVDQCSLTKQLSSELNISSLD